MSVYLILNWCTGRGIKRRQMKNDDLCEQSMYKCVRLVRRSGYNTSCVRDSTMVTSCATSTSLVVYIVAMELIRSPRLTVSFMRSVTHDVYYSIPAHSQKLWYTYLPTLWIIFSFHFRSYRCVDTTCSTVRVYKLIESISKTPINYLRSWSWGGSMKSHFL